MKVIGFIHVLTFIFTFALLLKIKKYSDLYWFYLLSSALEKFDSGCEFGWINYAQNKRDFRSIAKQVLNYRFSEESKFFYQGPDEVKTLEHGLWRERCVSLLNTFFSRDGQYSGIITFPDTNMKIEGKPWLSVMNTLKNWCKNSSSANAEHDDATGLIIRNYDLMTHLDFCEVTVEDRKERLSLLFKNFESKFKLNENSQRFFVFNPSEKIILVIRMVEGDQCEKLKNEAHLCIEEVNIVCLLLKDELKNSGVVVAGLVTYSGENAHSQSNCRECCDFIVTSKIFDSVKEFDKFWKSFVKKNMFKTLIRNTDLAKVFEAVGGKMLGYLAHLQFETLDEATLPITENNPSANIKQAELLLDRYQIEIAYSGENRILLHGNYGTGKTVVALKRLELLHKCLKENEVIYYVNFAGKSRLDCMIKQKFKTYEKVRVLRGGPSLSHIVTNDILLKENKSDTKNIHLIVDEYNSEHLSKEESRNLYKLFTEEQQFENSTLLIALQPIKTDRENRFSIGNKIKKDFDKKHVFNPLITILKEYRLKFVMRTTVEINTLLKITQDYLSEKSNKYVHLHQPDKISSINSKTDHIFLSNLSPNSKSLLSISSNNSPNPSADSAFFQSKELTTHNILNEEELIFLQEHEETIEPVFLQELEDHGALMGGTINPKFSSENLNNSDVSTSSNIASVASSSGSAGKQFSPSSVIDFDESYKLTFTPGTRGKKHLLKTVTTYSYTCDSEIGHNIHGPLPLLIQFQKSFSDNELMALIAFFLKKVIHIESKRIAIIHFESNQPIWLQQLIKLENCFKGLRVTDDVGEFLTNTVDSMVLINSYNTVKGLEFSEVLLILEKDEYYLKQYIPEAIGRCKSNLSVLIRPSWKKNNLSNTVKNLVDHWKEINEVKLLKVKTFILKFVTLGFCSDSNCKKINKKDTKWTYCSNSTEQSIFYSVHTHTEWYKILSKDIKNKIIPNLKLDDKKKETELERAE